MTLRDLLAAPGRRRAWKRAGRQFRRIWMLPPPEPGSEAAEQLAYWRRIRSGAIPRHYSSHTRRRPA